MAAKFHEFIDRKGREERKELGILAKVLQSKGMSVNDHAESDEPYIFVRSPERSLSFDGIRIYKIGDSMAFRVQKEEDTHPYGRAYKLDVQEMYKDYLTDDMDESHAGHRVMETLAHEIKKFFEQSVKAEKELKQRELEKSNDPLGKVIARTGGTDYSNLITSTSP